MLHQSFFDIYTPQLAEDAILHTGHPGFEEDYLILHCLLRKYRGALLRVLEVGTYIGHGTSIICNALTPKGGAYIDRSVFSLDLPAKERHKSTQYPKQSIGFACQFPFTQLRGDSLLFNYRSIYPIDAWYIDAEHDYVHAAHESWEAATSGAKLIIWHDSDLPPVFRAINDVFEGRKNYAVIRVHGTRITYALSGSLLRFAPDRAGYTERMAELVNAGAIASSLGL